MKSLILIAITLTLVGCSHDSEPLQMTRECMNYRGMMVAPMDPVAMQHLEDECNKSMKKAADNK